MLCHIFNIKPGKKFDIIKIPPIIKRSPNNIIASALCGAFDGDGWVVERTRRIGINSNSKQYMEDIHNLMLLFDIESYVRGPDKRGRYLCEITRYSNVKKFRDFIGFFNEKRKNKLEKITQILSNYPLYSTNEAHEIILDKIKEYKKINSKELSSLIKRSNETTSHHLRNLYNNGKIQRNMLGKKYIYSLSDNLNGVKYERITTTCR